MARTKEPVQLIAEDILRDQEFKRAFEDMKALLTKIEKTIDDALSSIEQYQQQLLSRGGVQEA